MNTANIPVFTPSCAPQNAIGILRPEHCLCSRVLIFLLRMKCTRVKTAIRSEANELSFGQHPREKVETLRTIESQPPRRFLLGLTLLLVAAAPVVLAQKLPMATRIWSVGPLTKGEPVMGVAFGPGGPTVTGPHVDSQTGSIYAATHSVAFAGDRVVVASRIGMRKVEGHGGA